MPITLIPRSNIINIIMYMCMREYVKERGGKRMTKSSAAQKVTFPEDNCRIDQFTASYQ